MDTSCDFPLLTNLRIHDFELEPLDGLLSSTFPLVSSLAIDCLSVSNRGTIKLSVAKWDFFLKRFPSLNNPVTVEWAESLSAVESREFRLLLEESPVSIRGPVFYDLFGFTRERSPALPTSEEQQGKDEGWAQEAEEILGFMDRTMRGMTAVGGLQGIRRLRPFFDGWDVARKLLTE